MASLRSKRRVTKTEQNISAQNAQKPGWKVMLAICRILTRVTMTPMRYTSSMFQGAMCVIQCRNLCEISFRKR